MSNLAPTAAHIAAAILILLAALHLYWALGGVWPGQDEESLARTVVGGPAGMRMPSVSACMLVATALVWAACLVVSAEYGLFTALPGWLVQVLRFAVVGAFGLRGLIGFFDARVRPSIVGTRYERLNVRVYSPLCLVIAALSAVSMA